MIIYNVLITFASALVHRLAQGSRNEQIKFHLMRTYLLGISLVLMGSVLLPAQKTAVFTDPYADLKAGQDWYHHGLFLEAQRSLSLFLEQPRSPQEKISQITREQAGLMVSQAAIRADDPLAERKILEYARSTSPDPMGNQALLEAGHYYFNQREYDHAIHFYEMVNTAGLGVTGRTELTFKRGYSYFVKKQFSKAKGAFYQIRDTNTDYYYPANYYYGMTLFFEGKYEDALHAFKRVEVSDKYAPYVPYIIAQILFAQKKYDELITYVTTKKNLSRLENRTELEHLLGRSYFEKSQYKEALPHLEYYAERSSSMLPADFYQLGYCQYLAGQYDKSVKNLEPLSREQNALGQQALFILGDAFLKTHQKPAARNAFLQASKMTHSPAIAEESLLQFGKLSYELRADREAVQALSTIPSTSPHHAEAQKLLGELLVRTDDTDYAIQYLSNTTLSTPQLKEAYQKVHYNKAAKLLAQSDPAGALPFVKKSLSTNIDPTTQLLATFLLGDILHQTGQYPESISEFNKYFTLAKTHSKLPVEASVPLAQYIQGYNLLKTGKHSQATGYFQDAVAGLKRDLYKSSHTSIRNQALGDAILRAGDCFFKVNKYSEALGYYNDAIQNKYAGFHYARFQKAMILGLQKKPYEKIVELEQLISEFPNSDYADDALYEIGNTTLEMGKLQEAAKPFQRLVKEYANRSNLVNASRLKLGLISYNQGDIQEAIRYYRQVLENNPDTEERQSAITALEEIYVRDLSSPDEYFAILEKSGVNLSDTSRDSVNFKSADNHFVSGQYDKAIPAYTQYIQRFPNGMHILAAYYRRGECYRLRQEWPAAFSDYEQVIGRGKSRFYEDALYKAGTIASTKTNEPQKAFQYFQSLEEVASNETIRFDSQVGALQSAWLSGKTAAVLSYGEKIQKNPQAGNTHLGLSHFYIGKVQLAQKQYSTATQHFTEVLKYMDDQHAGEAHYLIAEIHFSQREYEACKQQCLQSNQVIPGQDYWVAKCIILLSDVFVEEKDLFNARAALESLLDNYEGDQELRKIAQQKLDHISVLEGKSSRISKPRADGLLEMQEID